MLSQLLLDIQFGGYVSPIKLGGFVILFFLWFPAFIWINNDAIELRTDPKFWTAICFGIPAVASILCLLLPFFIIGIMLFAIAFIATSVVYVMHRNALVPEFQKVLTIGHIKGIFSNDEKKAAKANKGMTFITANKNDVPTPEYKTPEFYGFELSQEIVEDALWRRASEVTFMPGKENYNIYYKIDGLQTKQEPKDREDMEYLVKFLKSMGDMDMNEKRKPQVGSFYVQRDKEKFEFQIKTAGSTAGEKIAIVRVEEESLLKLDQIGLTNSQFEQVSTLNQETNNGIFLVTGPGGSGVTTTFYAMLRNHDPFMHNIVMLEKQETTDIPNITQNYFKLTDTGTTTYARKLQSMLRTGPDIVGLADCDDAETAQTLVKFIAPDPRTVYATMHAPSVLQALAKWLKFVPDRNEAVGVLRGISCQRLVRKLCSECRQAYIPNREVFKKFNIPADKVKHLYRKGEIEYDKNGKPLLCEQCQGTGFIERTGIFETILFDDELKEAVKKAKSLQEIANYFRRAKMFYLQEQAIKKVAAGITSIDEIIREFAPKKPANNKQRATDK